MRRTLFFALLCVCPCAAQGGFEGVVVLAGMSPKFWAVKQKNGKTACANVLASLADRPRPGFQAVWGTFGRDLRCLRKFARRFADRAHLIEMQLSNETCRDGPHPCSKKGELYPHLTVRRYNRLLARGKARRTYGRLKRVTTALEALANENSVLALSLGLEDRYDAEALGAFVPYVRAVWPHLLVRNPGKNRGRLFGADFFELHTPSGTACQGGRHLVSNDGFDLSPRAAKRLVRDARAGGCWAIFAFRGHWQARFRGRAFVPPLERGFVFAGADVEWVRYAFSD